LLGSINWGAFVDKPFTEESSFNEDEFREAVRDGVIALNEVLDENIELLPLEEQKEAARELRQIGLGDMGIADMLIKLGIRYGSEECNEFLDRISKIMADEALRQSALLARDNGTFPRYEEEYVLGSPFVQENATQETIRLIEKYGLRNSQLLTIAPNYWALI